MESAELIALLNERDQTVTELQKEVDTLATENETNKVEIEVSKSNAETLEAEKDSLAEANEALKTEISDYKSLVEKLQAANAELSKKEPSKGTVLEINGDKYLLTAPYLRYSSTGRISAEDLAENPKGKYNEFLERLIEKGTSLLKKIED